MKKKRRLFLELMEGLDALAAQRQGKRTLRTYVDMKEQMGFTFEVMDNR